MLQFLFFAAATLVAYTYAAFPLLVFVRGRFFRRRFRRSNICPAVTLVITCDDDKPKGLETKLRNALALDYPAEKLQIVVAASRVGDAVAKAIEPFADRVLFTSLVGASDAATLNAAVEVASGDVLVVTDVESILRQDAIYQLVRPLRDVGVGGVVGDVRTHGATASSAFEDRNVRSYTRWLHTWQSHGGSVTAATGAIFAVRRELFSPIPAGTVGEFIASARVVAGGARLVFARDAVAYHPTSRAASDFQANVRLLTRRLRSVIEMRRLLNPLRYGFYSVQLLSQEILLRLIAVPLCLMLVASPLLWGKGWIFQAATIAQLIFYCCAAMATCAPLKQLRRSELLTAPARFVSTNVAALVAMWQIVRERRVGLGKPHRA